VRLVTDPRVIPLPTRQRRFGDSRALGMALFIFTEAMLFAGFISAFIIVRTVVPAAAWPPPDQPRLPVERTAINTVALLLSGVLLWVAGKRFRTGGAREANPWMGAALGLGVTFVGLQGVEWIGLLRHGLTLTSSQLGAFFYTIVGAHALHAVAAIVALGLAWRAMLRGKLTQGRLTATSMFWYFVVLVWPLIYWKVYL
jgi:heme/copper-type cytochrome/quinol oxidase subunit 3